MAEPDLASEADDPGSMLGAIAQWQVIEAVTALGVDPAGVESVLLDADTRSVTITRFADPGPHLARRRLVETYPWTGPRLRPVETENDRG